MLKKSTKRVARRASKKSTHSSQKAKQFDAEKSWRGLEARLKRLELLVAQLDQERRERNPYVHTVHVGRLLMKRGPKTIPDFVLAERRDELIAFFESNWPELEPLCTPPLNFKALKQAFQAFANPGQSTTPWGTKAALLSPGTVGNHSAATNRLLRPQVFSQFKDFLKEQKRFAANPRQLANALAGCPDLMFWTSLKRCQRVPFRFGIDPRAMRSYIRRKHPKLYQKLSERPSLPELAAFCRRYRTKDSYIAGLKAEALEQFWEAGTLPAPR